MKCLKVALRETTKLENKMFRSKVNWSLDQMNEHDDRKYELLNSLLPSLSFLPLIYPLPVGYLDNYSRVRGDSNSYVISSLCKILKVEDFKSCNCSIIQRTIPTH